MLNKDHKISIDPIYSVMQIMERLFCITYKKTVGSGCLCYSVFCHPACLKPVLLVAKLPMKQHFCLVFPNCKCAKLSSERDAGRESESELLSIFLLILTCVLTVRRRDKAMGGTNSFSLISGLLL